jgi:hypothetical protein
MFCRTSGKRRITVNRFSAFLLLACSAVCFAQSPQLKSGATVYFEPGEVGVKERDATPNAEGGFETYLAAAFIKISVPLVVVTDKDKADYIIKSNVQQTKQRSWKTSWDYINASISVIDPRTSQMLFAASATPNYTYKSVAEDCAKKLKQFIASSEKKGREAKK